MQERLKKEQDNGKDDADKLIAAEKKKVADLGETEKIEETAKRHEDATAAVEL